MNTDNRLAKYLLLYSGIIALATLLFAYFSEEKLSDKALGVLNNVTIGSITGIFAYLNGKYDSDKESTDRYNALLEDYENLEKQLNGDHE